MKKTFVLLSVCAFLLVGCSMSNTPSSNVDALFMKYQKVDGDIDSAINDVVSEQNLTDLHRDRYKKIIENQYRNLSYEIKDERIDGDNAIVVAEIEVIDYKNAISDLTFDSTIYTKETFDEAKLDRLENAHDKVTYTLELLLTKDSDGVWKLNPLTEEQMKKIQGMY